MTQIFHITKWRCLPSIVADGGLWCDRVMADRPEDSAGIGYAHLKGRRASTPVTCGPRGYVSDYVPFYFAPRSPMLLANKTGEVDTNTEGQVPVIHLVASAEDVEDTGLDFVFTDGHPVITGMSSFYDSLDDLDTVAWDILKGKWWHDTDMYPDRKRRRQAEFLVHEFFPWTLVRQIAVLNEQVREDVLRSLEGVDHQPVIRVVGTAPTKFWPEGYYYQ